MNDIIGKLWMLLGIKDKDFKKGMDDADKKTGKLGASFKKLKGLILGALSVVAGARLVKDMFDLGVQTEGVRNAFKKLNDPTLFSRLKIATRGTVSDFKLMKAAVTADALKLSLKNLPTYFEFATKRANETGESVDYLVDSIVKGLGRKSVLILDNLGLSSVELQEEFKRVGDFGEATGNIIRRELESMGDVAETASERVAKMGASWENVKTKAGVFFRDTILDIEEFDAFFTVMTSNMYSGWTKALAAISGKKLKKLAIEVETEEKKGLDLKKLGIEEARAAYASSTSMKNRIILWEHIKALTKAQEEEAKSAEKLPPIYQSINDQLTIQKELKMAATTREEVAAINDKIQALEAEKKALDNLSLIRQATKMAPLAARTDISGLFTSPKVEPGGLADTSGVTDKNKALHDELQRNMAESEMVAMDLGAAMADLANIGTDAFSGLLVGLASGSADLKGKLAEVNMVMADFGIMFGKQMVAAGIAKLIGDKFLLVPGGQIIAAGLALIAVSSLYKGAISKGPFGSSGGGGYGGGGSYSQSLRYPTQSHNVKFSGAVTGDNLNLVSSKYNERKNNSF